MGRSNRLSAGNYHLVKRTTLLEFGIAIPAEFTNPARSGIEAYDDTALNMFHEEGSPGAAKTDAPGFRLVHCSLRRFDDLLIDYQDDAFVLQGTALVQGLSGTKFFAVRYRSIVHGGRRLPAIHDIL